MRVNEIFGSIDGEGLRAGELATFVRLAGCNLRCIFCDTMYAVERVDGQRMTIPEIVDKVEEIGYRNVTVTGGEPLIWKETKELVEELVRKGHHVNIETNGSFSADSMMFDGTLITMDYKTPYSGMNGFMDMKYFRSLRDTDIIKCVMAEEDMDDVMCMLKLLKPKCWVYLSPVFGEIEPKKLVEFMKRCSEEGMDTSKMRVQLQLHKYIWSPDQRGV